MADVLLNDLTAATAVYDTDLILLENNAADQKATMSLINDYINNHATTITEATTLANIASGESKLAMLGKIKKFFTFIGTTTLTTTAQTVTGAINELKTTFSSYQKKTWTVQNVDIITGVSVTVPSCNEIMCVFRSGNTIYLRTISVHIPVVNLVTSTAIGFRGGYYTTSAENVGCLCTATLNSDETIIIKFNEYYYGGASVADARLNVYYR